MSMDKKKRLLACVFVVGLVLFARQSFAQELIARSQLRRTTDPSPRAAHGSVLMTIDANGKQTFQVDVVDLGEANYGPFIREEPIISTNILFTLPLAPLNRTSVTGGDWSRTLLGQGQAPADFTNAFGSLTELSNNIVTVAQPGIPFVTTIFTNITGGVTNISMGVTNIVGSVTNIINGIVIPNPGQTGEIFSVLWAPLYELTANPGALSYHRNAKLVAIGDASPHAKGTVNISFAGTTGRSVFDVRAVNLTKGQQYTLFVANRTNQDLYVMIPVDTMTQINLGSTATLVRDTQFADPLPQQARDIGDLSGRVVQIRDAFDVVHLQGVMP
ncbi:MAG: hypothetical protein ABSD58_04935 [Verrucomicrobiia bacterium]|jgi:hypothetical protein